MDSQQVRVMGVPQPRMGQVSGEAGSGKWAVRVQGTCLIQALTYTTVPMPRKAELEQTGLLRYPLIRDPWELIAGKPRTPSDGQSKWGVTVASKICHLRNVFLVWASSPLRPFWGFSPHVRSSTRLERSYSPRWLTRCMFAAVQVREGRRLDTGQL